jgi:hypothetical protein
LEEAPGVHDGSQRIFRENEDSIPLPEKCEYMTASSDFEAMKERQSQQKSSRALQNLKRAQSSRARAGSLESGKEKLRRLQT